MKVKTIDITAKEWFDKINGNSYFSAVIVVNYKMKNEKTLFLPFQYGYGDHYQHCSKALLIKEGFLSESKDCLWRICEKEKIILRANRISRCKKSEL